MDSRAKAVWPLPYTERKHPALKPRQLSRRALVLLGFRCQTERARPSKQMADKKVKLGNTRVTGKEQYYTPPDLSREILERVCSQVDKPTKRVFLEPAGGTGSFIEAAKAFGFTQIVSMDIELSLIHI